MRRDDAPYKPRCNVQGTARVRSISVEISIEALQPISIITKKDPKTDEHFGGTGKSAVPVSRCWQLRSGLFWSDPTAARLGSRAQPRLLSASLNLALCCEAREPYIKGSTEKQHNDKLPALHHLDSTINIHPRAYSRYDSPFPPTKQSSISQVQTRRSKIKGTPADLKGTCRDRDNRSLNRHFICQ
jgi:hypothetical protein